MKNPFLNLLIAVRTWMRLRTYRGVFRFSDAFMQFERVFLPSRFHSRHALKLWPRLASHELIEGGVCRVQLKEKGLCYYWPGLADANHYFLYEQEFEPKNPHYYSDAPIALEADSIVLDVGACEGLFAFRVLKSGLARRVICFEPFPLMADLIRRAAEENGVEEQLQVEAVALGRKTGTTHFQTGLSSDGGAVSTSQSSEGGMYVPMMTIDDYCGANGLELGRRDLIKIDAEGNDVDVLLGARETIRRCAPQLAVTTYHEAGHAERMIDYLREIQPEYSLRLKGFSFWTPLPNPVLLQASCVSSLLS
jgi:FkbM family methyltransferase